MSHNIPDGFRLKTDKELAELPVRPWIFGWGDVVDDNTPRRYAWLYRPCCRNRRPDDEEESKTEPSTNI